MSLSYQKLNPVLVEDPITQVNSVRSYAILQSGDKISWKQYTSTSISSSSIQFSCPPPSGSVLVDRSIPLSLPVRVTIVGTVSTNNSGFVPATALLNSGQFAIRAWPVQGSLESLQVNINNDSVSIPMSDVIHPLNRYNTCETLKTREYSQTPCYFDKSANYSDLVGTNLNPLAPYGNMIEGTSIPRGGFPFTIVSNPTVVPTTGGVSTTSVFDFVATEALQISPFYWGKYDFDNQGFYNINSMDFNLSFLAAAGYRMVSYTDGPLATSGANQVTAQITSITVQFSGFSGTPFSYPSLAQPTLLFKYLSPNLLTKQQLGPNLPNTWPYFDIQRYPTRIGTLASGTSATVPSNNIQLSTIPRRMYIFARPTNQALQTNATLTDSYLAISNIQIQWANQSVLLSSASQFQLFQINTLNNGSANWQEFSGATLYNSALPPNVNSASYATCGSPLCISFGDSGGVQLMPDECPGMSGQFQLQVTATFTNQNPGTQWNNVIMDMYIVTVSEGTFVTSALGSSQHMLGVVSKMDVLNAQKQPGINYRAIERVNGGDFLGSLRSFGDRINEFLKKSGLISTLASAIPVPILNTVASNYAKSHGYGVAVGGGECEDCDAYGGVAVGGARMTKKHLKKSLMHR